MTKIKKTAVSLLALLVASVAMALETDTITGGTTTFKSVSTNNAVVLDGIPEGKQEEMLAAVRAIPAMKRVRLIGV